MAVLIRRLKRFTATLVLLGAATLAFPQDFTEFTEYKVKAAFLYNFAKFIEWPQESFTDLEQPFVICILGEDPFGTVLERMLAGKKIRGRDFALKRFASINDFRACQILFIASSERRSLDGILPRVGGKPILTVSEVEGFAERGGMINFTMEELRVRFEVNVDALERKGLKANSQLLKLARIVHGLPRAPGES